jgi:TolA-binding protein
MYPSAKAAKPARERVKTYEADEKFMAEWKRAEAEQEARSLLSNAAGYRTAGKEDLAVETYKRVIAQYPDTQWAEEAKKALEKP